MERIKEKGSPNTNRHDRNGSVLLSLSFSLSPSMSVSVWPVTSPLTKAEGNIHNALLLGGSLEIGLGHIFGYVVDR